MINIDPTILLLMGEVILALMVAMVGTLFFVFRGKKRDRVAITELQGRLNANTSKRQEWFESVLANSVESENEQANRDLATKWVKKENRLYTQLVNMYMERNSSALRGLDKLLHEYTSSYLELVSLMRTRIDEERGAVPDHVSVQLGRLAQEGERLSDMIKTLEQENERLSGELEAANSEIERAMREYRMTFRMRSGMARSPEGQSGLRSAVGTPVITSTEGVQASVVEMEEIGGGFDDDWLINFDESPDADLVASKGSTAAKGRVPDQGNEDELPLPELNEVVVTAELRDDQGPILKQDNAADPGGVDEETLLAQLEGLEEMELPLFSSDIVTDESIGLSAGKRSA